jgi:sialate O-acetylesterase
MREAQTQCMSIPNAGMVVISDLVDDVKIQHPQNKIDVAIRLANYALVENYNKKGIAYKSPVYRRMEVQKNKIRVWFDNAENGLMSKGVALTEFYIAGEDKQFVKATAIIDGKSIVVSNNTVNKPLAVRFGFNNAATPNVFNKEGLPVNLFRTDNWDVPVDPVIK